MTLLSIGDFARATHLSVKTLRYYHDASLLTPAETDVHSGYRRYAADQIIAAQMIRRFLDLGMPVNDVRAVVQAPDLETRNLLIGKHLLRLEDELTKTQTTVVTLHDLLDSPAPDLPIEHRSSPQVRVAAISAEVASFEIRRWVHGALGELYATVSAQGLSIEGVAGGIYGNGLFEDDAGTAMVFLPIASRLKPMGRVIDQELPAADFAVVAHDGVEGGIDRAYGLLASYVARHGLSVPGRIREFYPVNQHHTPDPRHWRTEIGWPILSAGAGQTVDGQAPKKAGH